jgi:hypothetical protein
MSFDASTTGSPDATNLAHDVVFADASGRLQARGRDAFVQSFTPFLGGVNRVELKQLIVEGLRRGGGRRL